MLDTAEYFEQRRELDKAVLLYQKAGKQRRALELCFSAQLFETLAAIANNLTAKSDPAVMARCGKAQQAEQIVLNLMIICHRLLMSHLVGPTSRLFLPCCCIGCSVTAVNIAVLQ